MENNTACLFHDVNQWDETISKMMCTIYFAFINAKYNWVIESFTEDEIKLVAERQYNRWLFSYTEGGWLSNGADAVHSYIKNDLWIPCNLLKTAYDVTVMDFIKKWYAVGIGIKANSKFIQDKKDGVLDEEDYLSYLWDKFHATNFIEWTCRWEFNCEDNEKQYFLDSYFKKSAIYQCNIAQVLEDIDMNNKYILYK